MPALLTDEIRKYIGMESELMRACDPVERGAVRRFAQAIMDPDPIYMDSDYARETRYETPVAPPLFPVTIVRTPFGSPDRISERRNDLAFDGVLESTSLGLPRLPLGNSAQLTGSCEFEMFRLARHGEDVWVVSRYLDIYERETSKGLMLFIVMETDFKDSEGQLICRFRKTQMRR